MKTKKWLVPLLAIIAVAAIACTSVYVVKNRPPKTETLSDDAFIDALPAAVLDGNTEFRQSDIPGIFYTRDPVRFYEFKNGTLAPVTDMVTQHVTMNIFNSPQKISFDLNYVRRGVQVTGFGEYKMDPDKAETILISDYYFIHAITLPPSVKVDRNKNCLLLIDSKKTPTEDPQRVYEETFFMGTESGKVYDRYIPDGSRVIDPVTGGKVADFAMFTTDQVLNANSRRTLYFSNGKYEDKTAKGMDVRNIIGTFTETTVTNVDYKYAKDTPNGLLYLRKNKDATGFDVYWRNNGKETVALSLPGDFEKDYLRSGDWLLSTADITQKDKLTIVNIATKAAYDIPISPRLKEASGFSVSPDGKKLIVAGMAATQDGSKKQTLLFYNLEDGSRKQLVGTALFRNQLPLLRWIDNATFAYNCTNFDTDQPQLCIAAFENALKSNTVPVTK